jgi:hypothetical protein
MTEKFTPPGHRAKWCIHYRYSDDHGNVYAECAAGIAYSTLPKLLKEKPCFLTEKGESEPHAAPCEKLRRPTPEEIAARAEWQKASMLRLTAVLHGIGDWRKKHKGKSHAEVVECPACKGRLHLSIAAYNGHVHGKCETEGCVAWME